MRRIDRIGRRAQRKDIAKYFIMTVNPGVAWFVLTTEY